MGLEIEYSSPLNDNYELDGTRTQIDFVRPTFCRNIYQIPIVRQGARYFAVLGGEIEPLATPDSGSRMAAVNSMCDHVGCNNGRNCKAKELAVERNMLKTDWNHAVDSLPRYPEIARRLALTSAILGNNPQLSEFGQYLLSLPEVKLLE